jgi:heme oxygenase
MLADELKEQTRDAHTDLEKKLVTHIQVVKDRQQYCALLALMYGYHAALENQLDAFRDDLPEYSQRRRSQSILNDLKSLSYPTESLAVCTDLPEIHSVSTALGVMYVLEGSTLGGKIVSKMLIKQVPEVEGAITFFQGYQEHTGEMWQKFKSHLHDAVPAEHSTETQKAAHDTFVKFKNWIDHHDTTKL